LFFDEDTGRGVPEALGAIGVNCEYVSKKFFARGGIAKETPDELWIPYAGKKGLLVFSCNKEILRAQAQRELWIAENVGGVFLTSGQENNINVLMLVLKRLQWLEEIDRTTKRPFAYLMGINGKWKLDPRVPRGAAVPPAAVAAATQSAS
jgi:hypothetical protein